MAKKKPKQTKISIIIPVSALVPESIDHRREAIQHALRDFYKDVEVIIVEQSMSGETNFETFGKDARYIRIEHPVFNKPWCCNVGVRNANGEYVVLCDADMYSRNPIWDQLYEWMKSKNYPWAFAWNRLVYTNQSQRNTVLHSGARPGLKHVTPQRGYSEGGLLCLRKNFYYAIGQANEFFQELGGPDNEIVRRCMNASNYIYPMFSLLVYHLHHPQRKKSSRATRKTNIKYLKMTQNSPGKTIEWLTNQDQGNYHGPLICRKGFME